MLLCEPEKSTCQETKERYKIRVHFFEKIQDWNFKSEQIQKWKNPLPEWSSLVPLTHHDPRDLGSICLVKKR